MKTSRMCTKNSKDYVFAQKKFLKFNILEVKT